MPHKLLLADDSVTIQRVIELTFADEDVQVVSVGTGQDAIDRLPIDRPDIVLADVGMPHRDGYDVAAFVKGNPATAHIPVVLLTGAFEPVDEQRARAVGCDGVLVKPFEPQMVIDRVKDLLAGRVPAGIWGVAQTAQGPVRPAGEIEAHLPPHAAGGDALEKYFEQLDAAFTSGGATGSSPSVADATPSSAVATATASLTVPPPAAQGAATHPAAAPPAAAHPAAAPVAPPPSLVDAFAALLSAEQQVRFSPPVVVPESPAPAPAPAPPVVTEEMIEEVSTRVLARIAGQVRPSVLDVAEKLVREEIEQIKKSGNL